jgi:hypothetical protein
VGRKPPQAKKPLLERVLDRTKDNRLLTALALVSIGLATVVSFGDNLGKLSEWIGNASTFLSPQCLPRDPATDQPDSSRRSRKCLKDALSYVKWEDGDPYKAVDPETGRWPSSRPNRSLNLVSYDAMGTPIWTEQNLFRSAPPLGDTWQHEYTNEWNEIVRDDPNIVPGEKALLLRRQDPNQVCKGNLRALYETYLPSDLLQRLTDRRGFKICYRKTVFSCDEKLPLEVTPRLPLGVMQSSRKFDDCAGRVTIARADP